MFGSIIAGILGAVGSFFAKWLTGRQARKDQIELGQEKQRNKTLEVDAEARKRVQQAEAKPRGDAEVEKDLDRGRFLKLLALALLLAACSPAPPAPTPPSAAPVPREYNCDQNRQAAADFRKLPPASVLRTFMDDYRIERKALRAFHNLPEPPACP